MSYMLALRQLEELDRLEPRFGRGRQPSAGQAVRRAHMASRSRQPIPIANEAASSRADPDPPPRSGDAAVLWDALRRSPEQLSAAYVELDAARAALSAPDHPDPASLQSAIERHAAAEDQIDALHRRLQLDWNAYKLVSAFGPRGTEGPASEVSQDAERDPLTAEAPVGLADAVKDSGANEAGAEFPESRQPDTSPAKAAAAAPAARHDEPVRAERVIASRVPQAVELLLAAVHAEAGGGKGRRAARERERVLLKRVSAQIRRGALPPEPGVSEPRLGEQRPQRAVTFAFSRGDAEVAP